MILRFLLCASVLAFSACGGAHSGDPDDDGRNCSAQTDCDDAWRKVCEDGYCSGMLPANTEMGTDEKFVYQSKLIIALDRKIKYRKGMSFRAAVAYPVTPAGATVDCATIESYEVLSDPSKYNLTNRPQEEDIKGEVTRTLVYLNGPGRVLYVELYDAPLSENPNVVGVACLEDPVPTEDGKIGMTVLPRG